jgi:uncharacterized phage protein gp47/JayE
MAVTIPTFEEIKTAIIGDIETALSQSIPILPKAVLRRLAGALAGVWLILYKYNSDAHRERFVQTASLKYLKLLGELVRVTQQPATQFIGQATIVGTGSSGTISAGTQFVKADTGKVFITTAEVFISVGNITLDLISTESGDTSNLFVSDILTIVSPLAGVATTTTISSVTQSADDAEDIETYRQRVLNAYQKKPQGGASADYESWGLEAPNGISIYPYTSTTPGIVDIYVEVDNQTDGIPTAPQLTETSNYINYDTSTGRRTRRPMTAELNMLPITRYEFDVLINALSPDTPATRALIDDAIEIYLLERAPYIQGLSINRKDTISQIQIVSLIFAIIEPLGATISSVALSDITGQIDLYVLSAGQKAKLGAVTYA